jgi:hypothetical protein
MNRRGIFRQLASAGCVLSCLSTLTFVVSGCASLPLEVDVGRVGKTVLKKWEFAEYGLAVMLPEMVPQEESSFGPGAEDEADAALLYKNVLLGRESGGLFSTTVPVSVITVEPCSAQALRIARLTVPSPGTATLSVGITLERQSDYRLLRTLCYASREGRILAIHFLTDCARDNLLGVRNRDLAVWQDEELFEKIRQSLRTRGDGTGAWERPPVTPLPIKFRQAGRSGGVQEYDPLQYDVLRVLQLHRLIYELPPENGSPSADTAP